MSDKNLRFAYLHAGRGTLRFHNTVADMMEERQKDYPVRVSVAIDRTNNDFAYTVKSNRDQFNRRTAANILTGRMMKGKKGPKMLSSRMLKQAGFKTQEELESAIAELVNREDK